jgi:flagellar hook-associated protein 3 FlgL
VRPFESSPAGRTEFNGDTGQRFLQISSGVDVEVRDNGKGLFIDIPAANNTFVADADVNNTGTGDINVGRIVDQAAYDAVFPDDLVIVFDDPLGPGSYTINRRDRATGVLTPLSTDTYAAGDPITVAGVEVILQGTPASGDQFTLAASNTQSLVATIQRVAISIGNSPDTAAGDIARASAIAEALNNLSQAESHVFSKRAEVGSRLNQLDIVKDEQEELKLINRGLISDLNDLDYNEAISRLSFQSFVLEAAQKSFAKVSALTLFNFLR